jgi:hypothetical protein
MRSTFPALLLGPALALGACFEGPPDLGPFSIRPALWNGEGGCESPDPTHYEMTCGATLSVRVVPARALEGDQWPVDPEPSLVRSRCVEVPPALDLTGLRRAEFPTIFDLPPERLWIEMALWNPLEVAPGACPGDGERMLDSQGLPLLTLEPGPAFAGGAFFDASKDEDVAVVPLACPDPAQLAGCIRITVNASDPLDVAALAPITKQIGRSLQVRVGEPRLENIFTEEGILELHVVNPFGTLVLEETPPNAVFSGSFSLDAPLDQTLCTVVREEVPQATDGVVCEPIDRTAINHSLSQGALLPKAILDDLLAVAGLDQFPPEGLVIGRVVDHTEGVPHTPLGGVQVVPAGAEANVFYPNNALDGPELGGRTSDAGWFVATGIPFGTAWTAAHTDGRRESGSYQAGLVHGKVTILIIRMEEPPQAG